MKIGQIDSKLADFRKCVLYDKLYFGSFNIVFKVRNYLNIVTS